MIPSYNRIEISVKGDTSVLLGVKGLMYVLCNEVSACKLYNNLFALENNRRIWSTFIWLCVLKFVRRLYKKSMFWFYRAIPPKVRDSDVLGASVVTFLSWRSFRQLFGLAFLLNSSQGLQLFQFNPPRTPLEFLIKGFAVKIIGHLFLVAVAM